MRKRILRSVSILLTCALLFAIITCAPFSTSAAEVDSADAVATVSADVFDSFGELSDGRYTLTDQTYALTKDFAAEGYLYVPSGVTAVIDLNGHAIDRGLTAASPTGYVMLNEGTLTVKDSSGTNAGKVKGGYAVSGGAVKNTGALTIEGGTFEYNRGSNDAGAISNEGGAALTVTGGVFSHNTAETNGGGAIVNKGVMTMSGGTVSYNRAALNGGGVWSGFDGAVLNLTGGTITGNMAEDKGSGVFIRPGSTLNMSGSPVVKDNAKGNLYLEDNNVINVTGAFTSAAQIDVSAKNMPRAVTSGFNNGNLSAFTFANGHTVATTENGEVVPDVSTTMVSSWSELDDVVYGSAANSTVNVALSQDITNTYDDRRKICAMGGKKITIDLCGHTIDSNNNENGEKHFFLLAENNTTVTVKDSYGGGTITGGNATQGGVFQVLSGSTLNLYNVTLINNSVTNAGGAIYNEANVNIEGCVIANNTANSTGGAIYVHEKATSLSIKGSRICGNSAKLGGAIYQNANNNNITSVITGCFIEDNTQTSNASDAGGGAIYLKTGGINMTGGAMTGNTATVSGGAVYNKSTLSITDCAISDNSAATCGGAIYNYASDKTSTITDSVLSGNTTGYGGGAYVKAGKLNISGGVISGNTVTHEGGGVLLKNENDATLYVSGSVKITGNVKSQSGADIPGNVYLEGNKVVNINGSLNADSAIGITAANYDRKVTSGLNAQSDEAAAMFTADESGVIDNYDVIKSVSGGEVYFKRIDKVTVNSWSGLQNAINNAVYERKIILGSNITSSENQNRIEVDDDKRITLDLNGKELKAVRSSKGSDGHVIEVHSGGKLTVTDSAGGGCITGGYATRGGGVNVNNGGSFTLAGGKISGNQAEDGGGIYVNDSATFTMTGGTVTENTASDEGGGIDFENSATLTGGNITDNTAKYGGGVYYDEGGETLKLSNVTIRDNTSNHRGGGIYIWHGTVQLNSCTVSENTAKDGGAVYITDECKLDASNTVFEKNKSTNAGGGAIVNMEDLVLSSCTFTSNTAENNGGAIYNAGTAVAESCTFRKNTSLSGRGGAICQYDGSFTLNGGTIKENVAAVLGCGVYVDEESDSFKIKGSLIVSDNGTNDVYLTNGKLIKLDGALSENAKIGVVLYTVGGTFTSNYKTYHNGEDPAKYFVADKNYAVIADKNGEAMVIESNWTQLRKQFENADQYDLIRLEKDWSAIKGDTPLTVAEDKSITLDLNGHTIDGKKNIGTVITVNGTLTITDSSQDGKGVITGGAGTNGGAVINKGTLNINGGVLSGNTATSGGAVYNEGTLVMDGGTLKDNTATNGAGVYNAGGSFTITGGKLLDNSAGNNGGAVYIGSGTVNLNGSTVSGNTAVREGGGIYLSSSQDAVLNVKYGPVVQNNNAPIGNNILLCAGKKLNVTSNVYPGACVDVVTKDTSESLTDGFGNSGSSRDAFTYNGSVVDLKLSDGELWFRETEGGTNVSSWDELQTAIDNAADNQVIVLKSDLDGKNKNRLTVNGKMLTIDLNGHVINRNLSDDKEKGEVLYLTGGAKLTIADRTGTGVITGGKTDEDGGGINIDRNATCIITGGSVQGNYADSDGGGIRVDGVLIMEGGAVAFNSSDDTAGGIYCTENGTIKLDGALVTGNYTDNNGGGMNIHLANNDSYIKNSLISNNYTKDDHGGGLRLDAEGKKLTIENTHISGNTAKQKGGGIYLDEGTIKVSDSFVLGNTAKEGGGIFIVDGKLEAEKTDFNSNEALDGAGGAINCHEEMKLTTCNVRQNTAKGNGGGIYLDSKGTDFPVVDTNVEENETTKGSGGGIFVEEGRVKYEQGSISYNKSHKSGGGVYLNADDLGLETNNTQINHNKTDKADTPVRGGGVFLQTGQAKIKGGSVSYNFAKYSGGGVFATENTKMYIEPGSDGSLVLFDHNDCDLDGGSMYVDEDGYLYLYGCKVTNDDSNNAAIFCGDDLYIKGQIITEDNQSKDIFIEDEGDYVILQGKLAAGSKIGVSASWKTGRITDNFATYHNGEDPETYLFASEDGYAIGLDNAGEALIRSTEWIQIQNIFDTTVSGGTVTLQRDYKADKYDTSLKIPADKSLTLDLNGFELNGGDAIRLIEIAAGATLTIKDSVGKGKLTGGNTTLGGGAVYNEGTLTVESGIFADNTAGTGGAVWNNGTMTVSGGAFTNNTAKSNGGAITNLNKLTITAGTFEENTANGLGGGIYNNGELNLQGSSLTKNEASGGGGIFCAAESKLNVLNAPSVIGNIASSGKNILLSEGKFIKLSSALTSGARLDVSTQDIDSPLTSGFGDSGTALSVFSYNEDSTVTLEVKNKELYYPKSKITDVDVWANGWDDLQSKINSAANKTVIGLDVNLGASGQKRIVVDNKEITLELAGHVMDRHLSGSENPGNVLKVTGSNGVLNIRDTVGSGMITGGYASGDGGGIYIDGNGKCVIESGTVCGNKATSDGGGIAVKNGTLKMTGGSVVNNSADDTGGGIYCYDEGTLQLDKATVNANMSENDGGGLNIHLDDNNSYINNSFITNNKSRTADGGGFRMQASGKTLNLNGTFIDNNSAENLGGGLILDAGSIVLSGGSVSENTAEDGGGVYVTEDTEFTAKEKAVIGDNKSTEYGGGGITCYGELTLDNATVSGNKAKKNGGGVYYKNSGVNADLSNAYIAQNESEMQGGGIFLQAGKITMTNGEVSQNTSTDGGGIYVTDDTDFIADGATFSDNEATERAGGAIASKGDVTVKNSTFTKNIAYHNGGGIYSSGDELNVESCTFTENQTKLVNGGAVCLDDNDLYLKGANTFKDNEAASFGSAVFVSDDADLFIEGTPVICENFGTNVYLDGSVDGNERLNLTAALNSGAKVGVTMKSDYGTFTKNFKTYNDGCNVTDYFTSDYQYEVYEDEDGEAALRWVLEEDNGFIDRNNNIADPKNVTGQNWMSAVSGERRINELNLIRAHDAAMNDVSANINSSLVKIIGGGTMIYLPIVAVAGICSFIPGINVAMGITLTLFAGMVALYDIVLKIIYEASKSCARTQYLYIDDMMQAGVRIFDLRINNKNWEELDVETHYDDNKNLWLCHGESPIAGCFYGMDHEDKVLSLDKTLTWAKDFLKSHPTEVLMYEFDMETQDNKGKSEVVLKRLQRILRELSYEINPSTGKPYLYMEDGEFGKYYTYWPKLKDCRGQLLIRVAADPDFQGYNELVGGYLWPMGGTTPDYTRATTGGGDTVNTPKERVDNIKNSIDNHPLPYVLKDALVHRNVNSGTFVNTTDDPMAFLSGRMTITPLELEQEVYYGNDETEGLLYEGGSFNQHGLYYGIFGGDGLTQKETKMLWSSNFYDDIQYCTITVKTGVEGDQQEKTYRVLKGTTITIPGSVYDNPYSGQRYFQNWKAQTGDTYDWTPDYSLQTDLGFDYTRTDYPSNRDWLMAHSTVEEIDPTTQIDKNSTRIVEPGEQITIMDDTEFTAQWGPDAKSTIEVEWNDCDNADDLRPKELNISYKLRGEDVSKTAKLSGQTDWSTTIDGLLSENAEDIYPDWVSVTDNETTGYICTVSQKPGKTGYTLKLSHLPMKKVTVEGTITWNDNSNSNNVRPNSVTLSLLKNGAEVGTKNVDVSDNMEYSFGTLSEYVKPSGSDTYQRNIYTVVEKPFKYYSVITDGFNITNVFEQPETSEVSVNITWKDGSNSYGMRPKNVTLHLYDGTEKISTQELFVGNDAVLTTASFDVDEYEKANIGKEFNYHVEQDAIKNYSIKQGSYLIKDNQISYTNTLNTDDKYFKGHSLTLNGDINVNFFIYIPDNQLDNAKVSFKWFDKKLNDVTISADDYDGATGYYKVTCPVAAAEMTYDVTATLTLNGEEAETNKYSVLKYADVIMTDKDFIDSYVGKYGRVQYDKLSNLILAMLDYGGKAQKRFDRNLGFLANGGYPLMTDAVTSDMITTVPDDLSAGLEDYGLAYQYSSVVFLSGMSLRHFYKITDQAKYDAVKGALKFVDNEKTDQMKEYAVTPVKRGSDMVYFEMKDIPAAKLDYQYQLKIGSASYKFSVMDSVKVLMEYTPDDKTMELCKAAYRYNQAANKFFGIV